MKTSGILTALSAIVLGLSLNSCSSRVYERAMAYTAAETSETNADSLIEIPTLASTADIEKNYTWIRLSSGSCDYSLFTDDLVSSTYRGRAASYPVIIEEALEARGLYRIINPMRAFTESQLNADGTAPSFNLIVNATDPNHVTIERQEMGISIGHGAIAIESLASHYANKGNRRTLIEDAGYYGKLRNGEITFPSAASFLLWAGGEAEKTNVNGSFRIVLPERVAAVESTITRDDYALGIEYICQSNATRDVPAYSIDDPIADDAFASR